MRHSGEFKIAQAFAHLPVRNLGEGISDELLDQLDHELGLLADKDAEADAIWDRKLRSKDGDPSTALSEEQVPQDESSTPSTASTTAKKAKQLQSGVGSQTWQELTNAMKAFMARVVPWPTNDEPGYINVHWHLPGARFRGRAVRSIHEFCEIATGLRDWRADPALLECKRSTLYFCLSRQAKAKAVNGHLEAERKTEDALAFKSIWLDIDVKDKGYLTINEAIDALFEFIKHYKLPPPSAVVISGSGLHVYWFNHHQLSYAEWRPYAEGLKGAAMQWGLKCDAGLTANAACVLRIPGTQNFKTDPPKPVRLEYLQVKDIDFAADLTMLLGLSPRTNGAGAAPLNGLKIAAAFAHLPVRNLGEGIVIDEIPPQPFDPIKAGCAWLREAHDTGGKAFNEPQWNLTTLAAVFLENGHDLAHQFGNQHEGYTFESTEQKWEEKKRAHETKGVGWPSCEKIQDAGSEHCKSCPHFAAGESPINLALHTADPPPPSDWDLLTPIAWDPAELKVSFDNIPRRQWVYGTYLVRGEVTVIAAPGGVGKTALTTSMAVETSTGIVLMNEVIWGTSLRVLSINREDGTTEVRRRIWAFYRAHTDKLGEQPPERLYVIGADDLRVQRMSFLQTVKGVPHPDPSGFAVLDSAIDALRPDVLMLDPLVVFCGGGNMNDNAAMALVMQRLKGLAVKYNCAILVVHHTKKGGERGDPETISGAAAIVNLARRALMPVPMTQAEATTAGVLPSERFRYFKLVDAKTNFTLRSADDPWYGLHSVDLPNPEPPIYPHGDNVQAVVRVTIPLPKTADEAANNQMIQKAILDLVDRGKLVGGERYPYSANITGAKNMRALLHDALVVVAHATVPRHWKPNDLRAVVQRTIDKTKGDGWLFEKNIKTGRFHGSSALEVDWKKTPWSNPASPISGGTAADASEEEPAGGDEVSDDGLDPEADAATKTPR
jgi:hypothetical protein